MSHLVSAIDEVLKNDNCSGCGGCALVTDRVQMNLSSRGFQRPEITEIEPGLNDEDDDRHEADLFRKTCPGVVVRSNARPQDEKHRILGHHVAAWQGWATDEQVRRSGSSGGVLTALSRWLLDSGRAETVLGSANSTDHPTRTETIDITGGDQALTASGSRYAPACNLARSKVQTSAVLVGKPCEASAFRQFHAAAETPEDDIPLVLSFFCAGTPSQSATDSLVEKLGIPVAEVQSLRYRGNGWPGQFTVISRTGEVRNLSYQESWGKHLGRDLQSRCKVCVDGTGEAADIAVGDYWETDEAGFPIFTEADGNSVVIARTDRGEEILRAAEAAGVICLEPVDLDDVAQSQPLQTKRRLTLFGRLVGRRAAGRKVPRYPGFGLGWIAIRRAPSNLRSALGTFMRSSRRG